MNSFLGMRETEKTALFIDGANLYKAARALGFDMDYKVCWRNLAPQASWSAPITTPPFRKTATRTIPPAPGVDWLDYNGYTMVTKMAREFTDAQGRKRFKGSTDIELAVDLLTLARSSIISRMTAAMAISSAPSKPFRRWACASASSPR
ncbi:MAG: NYN domain-containing protein [Parvularculaceae bacterium]